LLITIEYDISIVDTSRFVQSPLLVEVEKSPGAFFGISLISNPETNRGVYIESVARLAGSRRSENRRSCTENASRLRRLSNEAER
jgi:hypothetical protein